MSFSCLDKLIHKMASTQPTKCQKQKPFAVAIDLSNSLQSTRVLKQKNISKPKVFDKQQRQSLETKSIIHNIMFDESKILNNSNSQTLSAKRKPLDLSKSSFHTPVKLNKNQVEQTANKAFSNNVLKGRVGTRQMQKNKFDYQQQQQRRYSFRTVKNENKISILIQHPFQQQPMTKQSKPERIISRFKTNTCTTKYTTTPKKYYHQNRNDQADHNLTQFLKNKLGLKTQTNQNSYF